MRALFVQNTCLANPEGFPEERFYGYAAGAKPIGEFSDFPFVKGASSLDYRTGQRAGERRERLNTYQSSFSGQG